MGWRTGKPDLYPFKDEGLDSKSSPEKPWISAQNETLAPMFRNRGKLYCVVMAPKEPP